MKDPSSNSSVPTPNSVLDPPPPLPPSDFPPVCSYFTLQFSRVWPRQRRMIGSTISPGDCRLQMLSWISVGDCIGLFEVSICRFVVRGHLFVFGWGLNMSMSQNRQIPMSLSHGIELWGVSIVSPIEVSCVIVRNVSFLDRSFEWIVTKAGEMSSWLIFQSLIWNECTKNEIKCQRHKNV